MARLRLERGVHTVPEVMIWQKIGDDARAPLNQPVPGARACALARGVGERNARAHTHKKATRKSAQLMQQEGRKAESDGGMRRANAKKRWR